LAYIEAGWALTKAICEIIDNEMAQSADHTWNWNNVAKKVVERIGPEASAMLARCGPGDRRCGLCRAGRDQSARGRRGRGSPDMLNQ
jgi:hypothetical protein